MATQSKYQTQGFNLYRKRDAVALGVPNIYYSQIEGACYEDDGYEDTDALAIVAMLRHQIDQGQGAFFSEAIGLGRTTGQEPVSQEMHDNALASMTLEARYGEDGKYYDKFGEEAVSPIEKKKQKEAFRKAYRQKMADVSRTKPKILSADELKAKKETPKKYTLAEDMEEVERWLVILESIENLKIIRTPVSVANIANWIRDDEHPKFRFKEQISCEQVRGIIEEFKNINGL